MTTYLSGSPRTELLLGLTQLNLTRALIYNIEILGYQSILMHDESLSPFCIAGPSLAGKEVMSLPVSLQPTALQLSTPHHSWLGLFPSPQIRNNLIVLDHSWTNTGSVKTYATRWKELREY